MIGLFSVGRQREVRNHYAEEQVRAERAVDQQRVLADPAEPGARGHGAFEHGAGVDVTAQRDRRADERLDAALERVEAFAQHVVVVVAARVARKAAVPRGRGARRFRRVAQRDRDQRARAGQKAPRIDALLDAAREVRHLARVAACEPLAQERVVRTGRGGREADAVEAERQPQRAHALGERLAHVARRFS